MPMPMDVDNTIPHPEDAAPALAGAWTTTSQQRPLRAIVAQLDKIEDTKETRLENNEDKEEKRQMESIM
eukprot:6268193-Amphidinium_carterae.1